ncbi:MAG: YbhB/YbcL family Raf kinase inhibitor-like protein [Planctomycetota bacterium]|nr:MAG: YbhB/YbcL family Raf kinase inhibitor-like protein [Planctomycetota bacterium]
MSITVESPAFTNNEPIPRRYTGDGDDVSPQLTWSDVPVQAKELALIMDDPDAPTPQPWVHWVIYKIPAAALGLPEGVETTESPSVPVGALQGKNSWGQIGYRGPAPPPGHGVHHYHFKLYALDKGLDAQPGLTKDELLSLMEGHILAQGELVGTYERPRS